MKHGDHGVVRGDTISSHFAAAKKIFADLASAGINFQSVVAHLEDGRGLQVREAWVELLANVDAVA
jgi:transaldolase